MKPESIVHSHTHTQTQVLDNTNWDQSETLLLPPFHGLELESMIEESPDVDDENEEEDSRGKWKTYVIPKSGTLYELSKSKDSLKDSYSMKDLYYFWEPQNFEIRNQWLRNLDTGVNWDLSSAYVTSYVNGVKDIITTSESLTPRIVENDDDEKKDDPTMMVRTKALSTRVNVIEITLSEKSRTHHRGNTIVISPESSADLHLWIGTIIAACRWGAQRREDSEQFSMNL